MMRPVPRRPVRTLPLRQRLEMPIVPQPVLAQAPRIALLPTCPLLVRALSIGLTPMNLAGAPIALPPN